VLSHMAFLCSARETARALRMGLDIRDPVGLPTLSPNGKVCVGRRWLWFSEMYMHSVRMRHPNHLVGIMNGNRQ
jgi:hypothetical protein